MRRHTALTEHGRIPLAPLVEIVLLLLLYLLASTSLAEQRALPPFHVDPPASAQPTGADAPSLTVSVSATGVSVEGERTDAFVAGAPPVDDEGVVLPGLARVLALRFAALIDDGAVPGARDTALLALPVLVVQADRALPWHLVSAVLRTSARAGFVHPRIVTIKRDTTTPLR